jgi:hypothetical protein
VCNFGFQSKKVEGFVEKLGKLPGFEVEKRKHLILSKLSIMAANTQVQQEIQPKSRSLVSFEREGLPWSFWAGAVYSEFFFKTGHRVLHANFSTFVPMKIFKPFLE